MLALVFFLGPSLNVVDHSRLNLLSILSKFLSILFSSSVYISFIYNFCCSDIIHFVGFGMAMQLVLQTSFN